MKKTSTVIVKSLTRKSGAGQLVRYVLRYISTEEKTGISQDAFVVKHNIRGNTIAAYIKEFTVNEAHRVYKRSDQVALYHTILSWSHEDTNAITPLMLKDIATHYIQLRGENNLYLGTLHTDRHHQHLHLIMSGTQLNGKSSRISQTEFAQLKLSLDAFQKERYPQLAHSLPLHGRAALERTPSRAIHRQGGRTSQKEELCKVIEAARSTAQLPEAVIDTLHTAGYTPYYRSGKLIGITSSTGHKYRFSSLGIDPEIITASPQEQTAELTQLAELEELRIKGMEQKREMEYRY